MSFMRNITQLFLNRRIEEFIEYSIELPGIDTSML